MEGKREGMEGGREGLRRGDGVIPPALYSYTRSPFSSACSRPHEVALDEVALHTVLGPYQETHHGYCLPTLRSDADFDDDDGGAGNRRRREGEAARHGNEASTQATCTLPTTAAPLCVCVCVMMGIVRVRA